MDTRYLNLFPAKNDQYDCVTEKPEFVKVLETTAVYICNIVGTKFELLDAGIESEFSFKRAISGLPQLPHEVGNAIFRWKRARWLSNEYIEAWNNNRLERGQRSPFSVEGEHPWTKKQTVKLILEITKPLFNNNVGAEKIVLLIKEILVARLQTAIILHAEEKGQNPYGWSRVTNGDGMNRYSEIKIYDRKQKCYLTKNMILEIDTEVNGRINDIRERAKSILLHK